MEEWKDIPGWRGWYQASSLGRIRSVDRTVWGGRHGVTRYKGKVLTAHYGASPYLHVALALTGQKPKSYNVHTLVLTTFVGPPPEGHEACHGLGGSLDNSLENLRWGTRQENADDRDLRDGTGRNQYGPWKRQK